MCAIFPFSVPFFMKIVCFGPYFQVFCYILGIFFYFWAIFTCFLKTFVHFHFPVPICSIFTFPVPISVPSFSNFWFPVPIPCSIFFKNLCSHPPGALRGSFPVPVTLRGPCRGLFWGPSTSHPPGALRGTTCPGGGICPQALLGGLGAKVECKPKGLAPFGQGDMPARRAGMWPEGSPGKPPAGVPEGWQGGGGRQGR